MNESDLKQKAGRSIAPTRSVELVFCFSTDCLAVFRLESRQFCLVDDLFCRDGYNSNKMSQVNCACNCQIKLLLAQWLIRMSVCAVSTAAHVQISSRDRKVFALSVTTELNFRLQKINFAFGNFF